MNWHFNEVIKTPVFWVLLITGCEASAFSTATTFYIRDIGALSGLTAIECSSLLSINAMVGFPVTVLTGLMLEKISATKVIAISFFC